LNSRQPKQARLVRSATPARLKLKDSLCFISVATGICGFFFSFSLFQL
jgi:hypothetical protein